MSGLFETLSGAKGIRADAKSQQNLANVNAARAEVEAKAERKKAKFVQKRRVKKAVEIESALIAKLGPGLASPVAGELIEEQAKESELDILLAGFEGEVAAQRLEDQAEIERFTGRIAKQRGKSAARQANIQFGIQLATLGFLGGFGKKTAAGKPLTLQQQVPRTSGGSVPRGP